MANRPEAIPLMEEAVRLNLSSQRVVDSQNMSSLAEVYMLAGDLEPAMKMASQALELSRHHKQPVGEADAFRVLGEIAARRDTRDAHQAEQSYRQALALAGELGMRPLVAHCHRGLGRLGIQT
jgi:tetratricopeptide (TPR) repeat protein